MDLQLSLISGEDNIKNTTINFEGVLGQSSVIKKLEFYLKAHKNGMPIPTLLFSGSHGLGKTYVAEKLAENLGRRFICINSKSLSNSKEFIEDFIIKSVIGETPITILMDESHGLSKDVTTILLSILNPNKDNKNVVEYKNIGIVFDMSKINVIFATTDAHEMFGPLKNRCEQVYFSSYSDSEMIDMLSFYANSIKIKCNLDDIAKACRNRARDGYVLAKNIERFAKINGINVIDDNSWNEIKSIFDIKPMGLNKIELDILKYVAEHGPVSCSNIALSFMVNEDNITSEIEVRLRELDFITNTNRGRVLTETGKQYLENTKC